MSPHKQIKIRRGALSLLELITAAAITSSLMTASLVVVRSSYEAWRLHDAEAEAADQTYAVLRHIVRSLRQAQAVTAITGPTDDAGEMSLISVSGDRVAYILTGSGVVEYWLNNESTNTKLAHGLTGLTFQGLAADGVSTAQSPGDVQAVRILAAYNSGFGEAGRTVTCLAWMRSW
ncbi:hypothetical protein Pla175_33110 [Pirellulimonas nuda]|uniref:Pseudopilin GspJ n=1 Tax=Pirellulimonas nuda TaxID=2528009 RepID=A0A518DEK6_9BACT|nr:hypothetical protein [Pirellulimonas nuda]QDU89914.1 hypothetical protein Pla175_33110 [Pirellulimonas nuda]